MSVLEGFEEAVAQMQSATALFCVSDIVDGYIELNNTSRTLRVKTIFLAMRHAAEDMEALLSQESRYINLDFTHFENLKV